MNLHKTFTVVFSTVAFFLLSISISNAYVEELDQRQLDGGACLTAYSAYNRNQTFQPTKNVLTKVEFKMKYRNGGNITLTIKDEVSGQTILSTTQRMGTGDGWETFVLNGDELGYILDETHQHSIWVGTDYYTGSEVPCWLYTSSDVYLFGTRRDALVERSGDLTFATYGYTINMGRENPEVPPIIPEEEEEEEPLAPKDVETQDEQDTKQEGSSDAQTQENGVPDQPKTKDAVVIEETDDSISPPELDSVIVDEIVVEVDEEDSVYFEQGQEITITGTATPGDTVSVTVGEDVYTATADQDGNWYVNFATTEMDESSYEVTAQSVSDKKGSKIVNLLTLKSVEATTALVNDNQEDTSIEDNFITKYSLWLLSGLALLSLGILIFLLLLRKKRKEEEKNGVSKDATSTTNTEVGSTNESVED